MSILSDIQSKLKAPKGQKNSFGNYKYRSCEDIVEAVKPILSEYSASLVISDEIVLIGDRYYVKATAVISTIASEELVGQSTAYAREPLVKKGMDEAQITGATSSYARKYALNGLLAIDDTKDADSQDNRGYEPVSPDPINEQHVQGAYDAFKEVVDADAEEMDYKRVQDGYKRLTSDEQIALFKMFGSDKPEGSRKGYKAIIKELIAMHPSDLINQDDYDNSHDIGAIEDIH